MGQAEFKALRDDCCFLLKKCGILFFTQLGDSFIEQLQPTVKMAASMGNTTCLGIGRPS